MSEAIHQAQSAQSRTAPTHPPASHPAAIFETVMYALTRPGANGRVEFATVYGTWTQDIAQAHLRDHADHIDYMLPTDMDRATAVVSRIAISVYDQKVFDARAIPAWDRVDSIVVAQRTDCHGVVMDRQAPLFVTHTGIIGRSNQITAQVAQAATIDPNRAWEDVTKDITRNTEMPVDKNGMWLRPRSYDYARGMLVIHITPVVAG